MQSIFEQLPIEITKSSEFVRIFLSLFIPYRTLNVNYLEELKLDKIISICKNHDKKKILGI